MTTPQITQKPPVGALFKVLASHGLERKGGFAVVPVQSGIIVTSVHDFDSAVARQLTPRMKLTQEQQRRNRRIVFVSFGSEQKSEMELLNARQAFMSVKEARKLGLNVGEVRTDTLRQRLRRGRAALYRALSPARKHGIADSLTF